MKASKPIPQEDPVPFAISNASARTWPVVTNDTKRFEVNYEDSDGVLVGRGPGRRFLAERPESHRMHVAVDLFGSEGDVVVACEEGTIRSFYPFYPSNSHEETYALFIQHGDFVINYGEVKASAQKEFGWRIGDEVKEGQPIARISSTNMLHFEAYITGTPKNKRWYEGQPRPKELLNPTEYLLSLAARANEIVEVISRASFESHPEQDGHGSNNAHLKPSIKSFIQSPNHSSRNGAVINKIVLHCTEGSLEGAIATFQNEGGRQVSAHYVIDRNGDIVQMVRDTDRANHCKGANAGSIGIEHVGTGADSISKEQAHSSTSLIRWLLDQYDIPKNRVFGHAFTPGYSGDGTSCPDKLFGLNHTQEAVSAWIEANI